MKKTKRLLCGILVLAMALCLAGCGEKSANVDSGIPSETPTFGVSAVSSTEEPATETDGPADPVEPEEYDDEEDEFGTGPPFISVS